MAPVDNFKQSTGCVGIRGWVCTYKSLILSMPNTLMSDTSISHQSMTYLVLTVFVLEP